MAAKDIVILDWPEALATLETNGAQPQDPKHIKDHQGKEIDNGFLWEVGTGDGYLKNAIKAGSIGDMVDKVIKELKAGDCIKSLALMGHGASGVISVGAGTQWNEDKEIDSNRNKWEPELRRFCDKFCDIPEIEILLLGCETGVCDKGAEKLYVLAKFLKDCSRGVSGKFCVYGTKRKSAKDVEDAVKNGKRDHLVKVCSDTPQKPTCLTTPVKEGTKKKMKPQKGGKTKMVSQFPKPNPEEFIAIAFRDLRTNAGRRSPIAFLSPQPISIREFLNLYDFSESYEPSSIPLKNDAEVSLLRADGLTETLTISVDYQALEYSFLGENYLYFLKNLDDRTIVKNLVKTGRLKTDC